MGRSPCCDKVGLKKGPWTPEEDQKLLAYIDEHGHGSWRALPAKAGLQRCGKSCRLRWTNYLRPDIKRGKFSLQEEQTIIQLHALLGNRWSAIATHLPKRTDNEIKNYWNTHLKKRLAKMGIDPVTHKHKNDALSSGDGHSKNEAHLSHMAQWESARLEAEARLARQSKIRADLVNSLQGRNSEFASSSSQQQKPAVQLQCLEVMNAFKNDVFGKTSEGVAGDMESPTSTLSSAAGTGETSAAFVESLRSSGGIMKEESGRGWKYFPGNQITLQSELHDAVAFPGQWAAPECGRGNSSEQLPHGNFLENFTNLLLSSSTGNSGGDYDEDNKNYWDGILHLVNSSPSHSPMF